MLADLRAYLIADSTFAGLAKKRLYYAKLPLNPTYPACRYTLISARMTNTHGDDASKLNRDLVQIDAFAKTAQLVLDVMEAVRARLNSGSFTEGSTNFGYIEFQDSSTGYEPETELFKQAITLSILWSPV